VVRQYPPLACLLKVTALAFHTLGGEPFSVTYTIVAEAAALTEQPNSDGDADGDGDGDGDEEG
jgi:hypothetical protein